MKHAVRARDRGHPEQFRYRTWLSPSCLPALTLNGLRRYITLYDPLLLSNIHPYLLLTISYLISSHLALSQDHTKDAIQQVFTAKNASTLCTPNHHIRYCPSPTGPLHPAFTLVTLRSMAGSAASGLLSRQLKQMQSDKGVPGISCGLVSDNIFEWEVMLMITDDCKYYGGTVHFPTIQRPRLSWLMRRIHHRRFLPRPPHLPPRIPSPSPKNDVPIPYFPP